MKRLFLSIVAAATLISCGEKGNITGTLENADGEMVVLELLTAKSVEPVDSVEVKGGSFAMNVVIPETAYYRLRTESNNQIILLLSPDEKINITGDALDLYQSYSVEGSSQSMELKRLDIYLRNAFNKQDSLRKVYQQLIGSGQDPSVVGPQIDQQYQQVHKDKRQFVVDFINDNEGNLVTLSAIESLSPDEDFELFERVENALMADHPNSQYVKGFSERFAQTKAKKEADKLTAIGGVAPEIAVTSPEGETVKLSDLRGKYVLIDFWASWCKPCRAENPNVVKVYNQFKGKNFEIFSVSLDKSKEKWVEAIAADKMTWVHGSELNFWQSSFVKTYNITGIPLTILIDPEGMILAKNLRGAQLEQELAKVL